VIEVTQTLSTIAAAIGLAKEFRQLNKIVDEAEFKLKMAEIQIALADAKATIAELTGAITERDTEIRHLTTQFQTEKKYVIIRGLEYATNDSGKPIGHPICPRCKVQNSTRVAMIMSPNHEGSKCPACGNFLSRANFYPD
jgi:hypothetical protein